MVLGCLLWCGEVPRGLLVDILCGGESLAVRWAVRQAWRFYARVAREGKEVLETRLDELRAAGLVEMQTGRRRTARIWAAGRRALAAAGPEREASYQLLAGQFCRGLALGMVSSTSDTRWLRTEVGRLVYLAKYRQDERARALLGQRAVGALKRRGWDEQVQAIVPAPPSARRGWLDLAADASVRIGAALHIPAGVQVLGRTRVGVPQKDLTEAGDKQANVAGAFVVTDSAAVEGRWVLLVDDLYDSGATADECARALKAGGARMVRVLALGRARPPRVSAG